MTMVIYEKNRAHCSFSCRFSLARITWRNSFTYLSRRASLNYRGAQMAEKDWNIQYRGVGISMRKELTEALTMLETTNRVPEKFALAEETDHWLFYPDASIDKRPLFRCIVAFREHITLSRLTFTIVTSAMRHRYIFIFEVL